MIMTLRNHRYFMQSPVVFLQIYDTPREGFHSSTVIRKFAENFWATFGEF